MCLGNIESFLLNLTPILLYYHTKKIYKNALSSYHLNLCDFSRSFLQLVCFKVRALYVVVMFLTLKALLACNYSSIFFFFFWSSGF
jgi:hypothetical protein